MPKTTGPAGATAPASASGQPSLRPGLRPADPLRRITAGFVHDVNNALNPILAAAYLLEMRAEDAAAVRDIADRMRRAAEQLVEKSKVMSAMLHPAAHEVPAAAPNAETPAADPVTSRRLASAPVATIRALVADDAAADRGLLVDLLRALGFDVVGEASTGAEAIAACERLVPDVVLLDVCMPGGGGLEAARTIAAGPHDVAIVLFTGDGSLELSDAELRDSAALAFLPKPAPPIVLNTTLRLAVARARELRTARVEATDAKQQLANRKLIERAKAALMQRMDIGEPQAYRFMQKTSQDRAVPLVEIARLILAQDGDAIPGDRRADG
jgi:response regulator NasT